MKDCHNSARLEALFAELFLSRYKTMLIGGAEEPVYLPGVLGEDSNSEIGQSLNRLCYREDFFASALHEIAHWCIAGRERRRQKDFGYWYDPDGRDPQSQRAFESVEVKPQALEFLFSVAAGFRFIVSVDNMSTSNRPSVFFAKALLEQVDRYLDGAVPPRANSFLRLLYRRFEVCRSYEDYLSLAFAARDALAHDLAPIESEADL